MGGLRGLTHKQSALARFFLIAPEMARLSSEAETMVGFDERSTRHHHQLSNVVTERHERMVRQLRSVLEDNSPFKHEGIYLVNIVNKAVLPEHVRNDILRQQEVGKEAFNSFVRERIIGTTSLWEHMTKVKLYKWTSPGKTIKARVGNRVLELKENRSLFARMAIAARSRPEIDMADTVSMFEMSGVPRSLFTPDGSLLPSQDKSKLMHAIEALPGANKDTSEQDEQPNIREKKALIVDGMALVHQFSGKRTDMKTFSDLFHGFVQALEKRIGIYDCVHIVFDHYNEGASLKHATRERRKGSTKDNRQYVCVDSTPIRTSMQVFLSHNKTKASLTEYNHFKHRQPKVVVSTASGAKSTHMNVEDLTSTHEEADTMLILHAVQANKSGYTVHILSPDTDVFVLTLGHLPSIGDHTCLYLGIGDKCRLVQLQPIYDALGADVAAALLGFHSFTGYDTTGRFAGKGKLTCWKLFRQATPTILEAFQHLGASDMPSDEVISKLEDFVCKMYPPKTKETDVGKLRWHIFKHSQGEAEKLPPTKDALRYHILRAHYQAMIWHKACQPRPTIPPPERYGWRRESDELIPIITTLKPAPVEVMELVRCGCGVGK